MIDTIKIKIPFNSSLYSGMQTDIYRPNVSIDNEGLHVKEIYFGDLPFGAKGHRIHFTALYNSLQTMGDQYLFFLEFSLPKYVYLHNVYLYYPDKIVELMERLRLRLNQWFEIEFPQIDAWVIQRLDVCYAWKLPSQEYALALIHALRSYSYPRKELVLHNTTITHKGTSFSVMFYLKHNEYLANAYKSHAVLDPVIAKIVLGESEGVLRFEVRLMKQKLDHYFRHRKGGLRIADLANRELLNTLINDHFSTLIRSTEIAIDKGYVIQEKLKSSFGTKKSRELFLFYQSYFGSLETKQSVEAMYDKSSINRKLKELSNAGVGLLMPDSPITTLSIPSPLVVNHENMPFVEISEADSQGALVKAPLQPLLLPTPRGEDD